MGGVGGIERGKWRQLYLNNNKKIKERQNHESLMGKLKTHVAEEKPVKAGVIRAR